MQYILSQEEYDALVQAKANAEYKNKETIQMLCTMVCDNLIFDWKWGGRKGELVQPWKCIYTRRAEEGEGEWYCDQCPVRKYCPETHKRISK